MAQRQAWQRRAAVLVAVWLAGTTQAQDIEGVQFADVIAPRGVALHLHRTALLRYRVVFRGYVAGLYLPAGHEGIRVLDDVPKRLEISYFWSIGAKDFVRATNDGIAANVAPGDRERLRPAIDRFNQFYADVRPGDRYALTYVPGVGTELSLNGSPRGTIPGAEAAKAIFAIWFGPQPFDAGFKRDMLGTS